MNKLTIIITIFLLCCCSKQEKDTQKITKISFSTDSNFLLEDSLICDFIPLETTSNNLFSDIGAIEINNNLIYIIDIKNSKLLLFDISGKFITQIGSNGNGPAEYMMPSRFYIDNEKKIITIADLGLHKILRYNLDNYQFISKQMGFVFTDCAWLDNKTIAWLNNDGFVTDKRESYYIKTTDTDLNEIALMYPCELAIKYGIGIGTNFYKINGETYLNLPFLPIVNKVKSHKIEAAFYLDFGKHKFATLEWLQTEATKNYASAVIPTDYISACNVKETDNYISASFYAKGANPYIGFYNKKTGKSCKYTGTDFLKYSGLNGISSVKGTYEDYFISTIYPSELGRSYIKNDKLRKIAEHANEEDNPILCLFKFK